jgi:hypothetical protein
MRTVPVVVAGVLTDPAQQMPLAQHDHVVE